MNTSLPAGIVTLVFTDIEGSTKLLHELGAESYGEALAQHRLLLRAAFARHDGVEVDTQGDAFFYAFSDASEAVAATVEGRDALRSGPIHVRVGIHTGAPHLTDEGYIGEVVHLGARIGAAGHGGQVLLSEETRRSARLDDDALLDLGEHRLKDFEEPVRILQLGTERFPPLKTISNTNLPRPASSFVGREREVAEVVALLRDGARLVSLTGPGGSGKTRLSIEAAAELVGDHRAGTFWVELAPIRDPALVSAEIAKTLGAKDGLAAHIGEREMLLVLDNLEQVIEAAPELADLVETCPNLRVIATSRERFRVRGEVEYPVDPLAEPDAAELFVARAGLAQADDDVRAICRALDDMPLAIELAAARVKVFSPTQILERLSQRLDLFTGGRDADPRQRTLRSTIEWSHDLLDADEQRLFARLAVFSGGCTFESAEHVADADLDTLGSLVEKSLVRRTEDRFWMYETIREFALEELEASEERDQLSAKHAEHFAASRDRRQEVAGGPSVAALGADLPNIRAALDWARATRDGALMLRLLTGPDRIWFPGELSQIRDLLDQALELVTSAEAVLRARGLKALALASYRLGDYPASRRAAEEGIVFARERGLERELAGLLDTLAAVDQAEGDGGSALLHLEEAIELFKAVGDDRGAANSRGNLADLMIVAQEYERAATLCEESIRALKEIGESVMGVESNLATACVFLGKLDEAAEWGRASLLAAHRLSDHFGRWIGLLVMAAIAVGHGDAARAALLLGASDMIREEEGMALHGSEHALYGYVASALPDRDAEDAEGPYAEGRRMDPEDAVAMALSSAPT